MDDLSKEIRETLHRPKEFSDILEEQIHHGQKEHDKSNFRLFISAFSAGLEVGFSVFLMAIFYTLFHGQIPDANLYLLISVTYSLGFIFVVIGRSNLFTELTSMAVLPVLNKTATLSSLGQLWGVIYAGNLIGGFLFSFLLVFLMPAIGTISPEAIEQLALKIVKYDWQIMLCSGIVAGWLMGLLSWLVTSAQETISRIFIVILITTAIGLGGLPHAIVGSIEVFSGALISNEIGAKDYFHFQIWTTLGNTVGGAVFVGILKYTHMITKNSN